MLCADLLFPGGVFSGLWLEIMTLPESMVVEALRESAQQIEQSSFLGFLPSSGTWLGVTAGGTMMLLRPAATVCMKRSCGVGQLLAGAGDRQLFLGS